MCSSIIVLQSSYLQVVENRELKKQLAELNRELLQQRDEAGRYKQLYEKEMERRKQHKLATAASGGTGGGGSLMASPRLMV